MLARTIYRKPSRRNFLLPPADFPPGDHVFLAVAPAAGCRSGASLAARVCSRRLSGGASLAAPRSRQRTGMTDPRHLLEAIDRTRTRHGFLPLAEMLPLAECGNVVFDPFYPLGAPSAGIRKNNVCHPNHRLNSPPHTGPRTGRSQ